MKNFIRASLMVSLIVSVVSCAGGKPWPDPVGNEKYEKVSWDEIWKQANYENLNGKRLMFEATWIGAADNQNDITASFEPYNSSDLSQVGLSRPGDAKDESGEFPFQQWSLYLPNDRAAMADGLNEGDVVVIMGSARRAVFAEGKIQKLALFVEKIVRPGAAAAEESSVEPAEEAAPTEEEQAEEAPDAAEEEPAAEEGATDSEEAAE